MDNITEIVGQSSYDQLNKLESMLDSLATKLAGLTNVVINIETKGASGGSAQGLINDINTLTNIQSKAAKSATELGIAVNEYKNIANAAAVASGKLAVAETDQARELAAVRLALQEKNKAVREEVQLNNAANDSYKKLELQLRSLTTQGRQLGIELGRTAPEYQKIVKQAQALREQLYAIDSDFGNHRRNVGNYRSAFNGLAASFNQLTRELPALAINANTFFLAISNNLPIFVDELRRATDANKAARAEAQAMAQAAQAAATAQALQNGETQAAAAAAGKLAAQQALANAETTVSVSITRQLFKAIFSWQSLLSVGVALLTIYGGKMLEAFSGGQSAAEKYDKALKEVTKSTSADIAELTKLQTSLAGSSKNRLDLQKAFDEARKKYPEYLGYLSRDYSSTEEINEAILQQIELLKARVQQQAAQKVLTEAIEDQSEAEAKLQRVLTGNQTFWEKTLSLAGSMTNELSHLTPEEIALIDAISGVTKAQNNLNDAREQALDPAVKQVSTAILYQDKLRGEIKAIQDSAKEMGGYTEAQRNTIAGKQRLINITEDLIDSLLRERAQIQLAGKASMNQSELDALNAQTRLLNAKKNSAEELKLRRESIDAQLKVDKENLRNEYQTANQNLAFNKEYQAKLANLEAKARNDKENADDAFNKKHRQKNTTKYINQEYKAQEDLNKALADFQKQRIEADKSYQETIFDNETESLDKRLAAHQKFIEDEQGLFDIETGLQLTNLYNRLNKIAELRKLDANKSKAAQDALTADEEAVNAQIDTIISARAYNRQRIQDEGAKKERQIVKSSAEYAVQQAKEHTDKIINDNRQRQNQLLADLEERAKRENLTTRAYNDERQKIIKDTNNQIYKEQKAYLEQMAALAEASLTTMDLPEEEKTAILAFLKKIKNEIGDLVNPKNADDFKSDSIWHMLGFGISQEIKAGLESADPEIVAKFLEKQIQQAKERIAQLIQGLTQTIFTAFDQSRENTYAGRFAALDAEAERLKRNAELEQQGIESSLLSQEEKERRTQELNARTAASDAALEAKRKALQKSQAEAEKRDAIFKAEVEGGVAIAKALSAFPPPYSYVVAALVAAQTAANIALIRSRKVPQYMEGAGPGTPNPAHPGGLAVVHGGEIVSTPGGKEFMTPGTANTGTLMDLPVGTTVTPRDQVMQMPHHKVMAHLVNAGGVLNENTYAESLISTFKSEIGDLKNTIKNKPTLNLDFHNGKIRSTLSTQQSRLSYIGKARGKA